MEVWDVAGTTALAAAVLLVVAGAPKVLDPGDLVRALRSVGLQSPPMAVRLFAALEVVAGLSAIAVPSGLTVGAVALLHAAFTAFVLLALTRGGVVASCGCFGRADTPPTRAHAAVTGGLALAAGAVAIAPPEQVWWSVGGVVPVATVALTALIAFLAWQVIAVLPATTPAAIRSTGRA